MIKEINYNKHIIEFIIHYIHLKYVKSDIKLKLDDVKKDDIYLTAFDVFLGQTFEYSKCISYAFSKKDQSNLLRFFNNIHELNNSELQGIICLSNNSPNRIIINLGL